MNNKHDEITCFAKNCVYKRQTQCSTFKLNDNAIGKSCGCAD